MLAFVLNMNWEGWLLSLVDIGIVAYGLYRLFTLIRGTRAVQLIKGIVVLLVAVPASEWLGLKATHQILVDIQTMLVVALPIVFQPELRRALEQIGQGRFFLEPLMIHDEVDVAHVIDEVVRAAEHLARTRTGALIVLERQTGLNEYVATGTALEAMVSAPLLENIFVPNTPLHDGAVIIRGDRIVAAGAFLPLVDTVRADPELGSRHRAALGVTEVSDAVVLVVSEETGWVSVAVEGRLTRRLEDRSLRDMLTRLLRQRPTNGLKLWPRGATPS